MIRKADINDVDEIKKMGYNYSLNFDNEFMIDKYINDEIYHIFVYDDEFIKGFIISTFMFDTVEILLVYVDEKYRNKQIGKKLLASVEKGSKILLEVSKENVIAYNLYLKCGYKVINIRKGYYHGIDAYVMEKVL